MQAIIGGTLPAKRLEDKWTSTSAEDIEGSAQQLLHCENTGHDERMVDVASPLHTELELSASASQAEQVLDLQNTIAQLRKELQVTRYMMRTLSTPCFSLRIYIMFSLVPHSHLYWCVYACACLSLQAKRQKCCFFF